MRDKMYLLIFVFLGLLNVGAFFLYKNRLDRTSRERYQQLTQEVNAILARGDENLRKLLHQVSNDCQKVIAEYRDRPTSLLESPSFDLPKVEMPKPERELDYYWFVSCGVPFITVGREHFTVGDILPTGETIKRINDYCITTDEGIIIYNRNCKRKEFDKPILEGENVSRMDNRN